MGDPQDIRVHIAPGTIKIDRGPVNFVLVDCFKMAFAVGAGFTASFFVVIGIASIVGKLFKAMFA